MHPEIWILCSKLQHTAQVDYHALDGIYLLTSSLDGSTVTAGRSWGYWALLWWTRLTVNGCTTVAAAACLGRLSKATVNGACQGAVVRRLLPGATNRDWSRRLSRPRLRPSALYAGIAATDTWSSAVDDSPLHTKTVIAASASMQLNRSSIKAAFHGGVGHDVTVKG